MDKASQLGYVPLQLDQIEYLVVPGFDHEKDENLVTNSDDHDFANSISYYDENLTDWAVRHFIRWGFIEE
jgi:hypothetical protein